MTTTAQQIRIVVDGRTMVLDPPAPTRTLQQHVREDLGRCGTNEGCAEGDRGACTVVIGRASEQGIDWRPLNPRIGFLPTLDGYEIVTVKSLSAETAPLLPESANNQTPRSVQAQA